MTDHSAAAKARAIPEQHLNETTQEFCMFLINGLTDIAIYMLSPTGHVQTWSAGAQILKQYEAAEVMGKHFSMFYTKPDQDRNFPNYELEQATRSGKFEGAGWRVRKDGTQIWVDVVIAPMRDKEGNLKAFVKVVRDATDKKKAEEMIERQRRDLIELSTPVMHLWRGILALPIVGTLDSTRSQVVTERLLQGLTDSDSAIAILDISGVPTVDTVVAQHLMKTVDAARLMGCDCIISGIRPEIAQTMAHLGVDLSKVKTKSSMARALEEAMSIMEMRIVNDSPKERARV
ncbi:MAG TPA: PAS domain S-box protein [Candidatus Obscuribacterales bacterium]